MTLRIGWDLDDVVYPWYRTAHDLCRRAGVTGGAYPGSWYPYREYGITREEWWEVLHQGVISGDLYAQSAPDLNAQFVFSDLRAAIHNGALPKGSVLVAVTARGETFDEHPEYPWLRDLVQEQTHLWLHRWAFDFDEVVFSSDKGMHELDYLVDDNPGNVRSVIAHGGAAFLLDQTWNQGVDLPRISSITEYSAKILEDR